MNLRHPATWTSLLSCAAISLAACGDDEKKSDTAAPDTSDPDTSEPDTSDPDTSEPDTTADTSEPDTTEPDTTPDTSPDTAPDTTPDGEVVDPPGNGEVEALFPDARDVVLPFDAALSPDASEIYYVSLVGGADGEAHQLFRSAGGETSQLTLGKGFIVPMGVVTDGERVFVFDSGYVPDATEPPSEDRPGAILVVPTAGGEPSVVSGTQGYAPVSGEVTGSTITFSGRDPADGMPGIFSVGTGGGAVSVVAKGGALVSPMGVVRTTGGKVYVSDPLADSGRGAILTIDGSAASVLIGQLALGTPAGIALSYDEDFLLASALDPATLTSVVLRIALADGALANTYQPDNIKTNTEAGGLHCARDVEQCVWSDLTAGGDGTGIVYRVTLK